MGNQTLIPGRIQKAAGESRRATSCAKILAALKRLTFHAAVPIPSSHDAHDSATIRSDPEPGGASGRRRGRPGDREAPRDGVRQEAAAPSAS